MGCGDFPNKYENVIRGEKIRPFAIVVDPPEAAPGDTVDVRLKMYDAEKDYSISWELGLDYKVDVYNSFSSVSQILNLDTGGLKFNRSDDELSFSIVVPEGPLSPMTISELIPDVVKDAADLSEDERTALIHIGVNNLVEGVRRDDLLNVLPNLDTIPNELSNIIDNMVALMQFKANVISGDFKLDVTKNLTVRYSNRLAAGSIPSNVNTNPVVNSIGIIRVAKSGVESIDDVQKYARDTTFFNIDGLTQLDSLIFDTLNLKEGYSYFAIASGAETQNYRSPEEVNHKEDLYYQWFYTNLDDVNAEWEDLITLNTEQSPGHLGAVSLSFPKEELGMKHFSLRVTVNDFRPEWNVLSARGLDHKAIYVYLNYESTQ